MLDDPGMMECSEIKQMIIKRGAEIHSIQTEYEKKGKSIWSAIHGGRGGEVIHRIKLDFPNEWLVCITGFYGEGADGEESEVLKSLTFYTNKGKYGPLGKEIGKFFTTAGPPGKVVGLMGSSGGEYLNSIGVHVEYLN
ncbi:hypothetical protein QJS10_CPB15g02025 [Acorus calamus]|uniref:Jacalin-type lectin domain-containing protein n=1 Tax=Acorus calamus TaxID=4465 RepID=A0AAV9D6U6_ACOCL|nr:hypothetical protein QJS10_CPB15g02025 [Acorus calamus]